jgi:hypothetical protein
LLLREVTVDDLILGAILAGIAAFVVCKIWGCTWGKKRVCEVCKAHESEGCSCGAVKR